MSLALMKEILHLTPPSLRLSVSHSISLCGMPIEWKLRNCLPFTTLYPSLRFLHRIFTTLLYPRKGNRTNLTPLMVQILYLVALRISTCLRSLICFHTCHFANRPGHCAYSFASLMTYIATEVFGLLLPKKEVQLIRPFSSYKVGKMNLDKQPH